MARHRPLLTVAKADEIPATVSFGVVPPLGSTRPPPVFRGSTETGAINVSGNAGSRCSTIDLWVFSRQIARIREKGRIAAGI
ncbi:MAG: hypothetical protein JNM61_10240 [Zoogloeaceae bacterium]|nr:hypothetical protein [Zoogloeaceae bacterium]